MTAGTQTKAATELPVLACGTCAAPVRYATEVEAAWSRLEGGWPDPVRDCLWCGPAGQLRAEWSLPDPCTTPTADRRPGEPEGER